MSSNAFLESEGHQFVQSRARQRNATGSSTIPTPISDPPWARRVTASHVIAGYAPIQSNVRGTGSGGDDFSVYAFTVLPPGGVYQGPGALSPGDILLDPRHDVRYLKEVWTSQFGPTTVRRTTILWKHSGAIRRRSFEVDSGGGYVEVYSYSISSMGDVAETGSLDDVPFWADYIDAQEAEHGASSFALGSAEITGTTASIGVSVTFADSATTSLSWSQSLGNYLDEQWSRTLVENFVVDLLNYVSIYSLPDNFSASVAYDGPGPGTPLRLVIEYAGLVSPPTFPFPPESVLTTDSTTFSSGMGSCVGVKTLVRFPASSYTREFVYQNPPVPCTAAFGEDDNGVFEIDADPVDDPVSYAAGEMALFPPSRGTVSLL